MTDNVIVDNVEVLESERQKCEVWTRVMGYHRPITSFNKGKQSEQKDRVHFLESHCGCSDTEVQEA